MKNALTILAAESPAFRRDEAMIALRRELVSLITEASLSGMRNGEKLIVIHVLSDLPAAVIRDANSERLEACRHGITEFIDVGSVTTTARRVLLLAADAYHTAAVAIADAEPREQRRAS
jgi:hypothetical protein